MSHDQPIIHNRGTCRESRKCIICKNFTKFMIHKDGSKTPWSKLRHIPPTDQHPVCHIHAKYYHAAFPTTNPENNTPSEIPPGMECSICLTSDCDRLTICGHAFHEKCINNWFNSQNTLKCPNCRNNVSRLFHTCESRDNYVHNKLNKYKKEADSLKIEMEQLQKRHDVICKFRVPTHELWSRLEFE